MAKSGKSLETLIEEIYGVGEFKYWRDDLHLKEELKSIVEKCNSGKYTSLRI